MSNEKNLKLLDLIDVDFLQKFQDAFAKTANVASIMVDDNGPITKPSNFTDFCNKYTRGTALGLQRCVDCDIRWGKLAATNKKPVIYDCHTGLTDFAVPIVVAGQHIASILGGQVLTSKPDEESFRKVAQELGINEEEYINEMHKIKIIPKETVDAAAQLMYLVANAISEIAHKNLDLNRKNTREQLYQNITESIRVSLNASEIKNKMVKLIGKALGADRCFFVDYNKAEHKFMPVKYEYLSSETVPKYKGSDVNEDVPNLISLVKNGNSLLIDKKQIFINGKLQQYDVENTTINRFNVSSGYGIPVIYDGKLHGVLSVHYMNEQYKVSEEELNFLRSFVDQLSIAFYQSELYEKTQKQMEKESVLRKITDKIRSSLNFKETLNFIVEEVANIFNVQRATLVWFPTLDQVDVGVVIIEHKTSEEIESVQTKSDFEEIGKFWTSSLVETKNIIAYDDIENSDTPDYFKETYKAMGVKSMIGIPIKQRGKVFGNLILSENRNVRIWTNDEKELLDLIADQVYIALYQSQLFEKEKKTAQRNKLITDIFSDVLSSLELEQLNPIVRKIGEMMNADRCCFVEADWIHKNNGPAFFEWENPSSSNTKSINDFEFKPEDAQKFFKNFEKTKDVVVFDCEKIRQENKPEYEHLISYIRHFNLKSGIGIPFYYLNKFTALLLLDYSREKFLPSKEEKDFLKILSNQVGLAYSQIKNYQNAKATAQREIILRQVIEVVRSSLDIKVVKQNVLALLCKIFKADRCFFRSYDAKIDKVLPPDVEYLASNSVKSLMDLDVDQVALKYFVDAVKKEKRGFYPIVVDSDFAKDTLLEPYFNESDIKADYVISIVDRHDELIWLVLHYAQEDPKLDADNKKLLETIAYQIDIAFEQIRLYNNAQKTAERESLLRKIFETMRSSLEPNVIKKTIVTGVGTALGADICFISTYQQDDEGLRIDEWSVYSSSEGLDSHINQYLLNAKLNRFEEMFKSEIEISYYDVRKFIDENNLHGTLDEEFLKNINNASGYGFAINYANETVGFLFLLYSNQQKILDEKDSEFVRTIATQAGITIYQANLYKITQLQAEREKISKNIIEILRSSLDKNIIKHLFVKNIGKYFDADRVFFSDYDKDLMIFLPVESDSEYLSSPDVISFSGYSLTGDDTREYIQSLLEKREFNIFCFEDYIKANSMSNEFISMFQKFDVKSSYNLPVLYQGEIIGYFCVEYTKDVCRKLSDEDINRIRNMCTQAGIALHHADLYELAQKKSQANIEFTSKTVNDYIFFLKAVSEFTENLLDNTIKNEEQTEKITEINSLSKQMLEKLDNYRQYEN